MRRIVMIVLLLSGIYADVLLWAYKHAAAQSRINVHPICVDSDASCDFWDIGWLDERGQFHFMQRMHESELRTWLRSKIVDGTLKLKE